MPASPFGADTGERASVCPLASTADITAPINQLMSAGAWDRRQVEGADALVLVARLPFCERPDIGHFAALVRPGVDRPQLVGLAILDHRGVVRALGE